MPLNSIHEQKYPIAVSFFAAVMPTIVFLAAVVVFARSRQIELEMLTKDFASAAGVPFYTGIVSNVGIYLWCAAAAICLFTFTSIYAHAPRPSFLLFSGLLTAMLLADDAFMVHEVIGPYHLGVNSDVVVLFYIACTAAWLAVFRAEIRATNYLILAASFAFFALSLIADKLHDVEALSVFGISSDGAAFFLEDGFKLFGIAAWLSYFAWTCHTALAECRASAPEPLAQ